MHKIKTIGILLSIFLIALDQISKSVALTFYQNYGFYSYSLFSNYLRLTFAKNHGAAFSITFFRNPQISNYFFVFLTIFAILFIVYLIIKTNKKLEIIAYFLIIAGAIGNLTDRILQGFVIDFIDCDFPDIIIERWPVFNLADSYICIAIGLFVIQIIREKYEKKNN